MKQLDVVWSGFAETELDKIFTYYCKNATLTVARKLVTDIVKEVEKLSYAPESGQIEELLTGRNKDFRYLVVRKYKVIYYLDIEHQQVRVVDVFDSRRNPLKMIRNK